MLLCTLVCSGSTYVLRFVFCNIEKTMWLYYVGWNLFVAGRVYKYTVFIFFAAKNARHNGHSAAPTSVFLVKASLSAFSQVSWWFVRIKTKWSKEVMKEVEWAMFPIVLCFQILLFIIFSYPYLCRYYLVFIFIIIVLFNKESLFSSFIQSSFQNC